MLNTIPYTLTDNTLTFYDASFKPTQVFKDHPEFKGILDAVNTGDVERAKELARPVTALVKQIDAAIDQTPSAQWFRRKAGKVEVTDWGVTLDGKALHGVVIDRLMEVLRLGMDVTPWVNFVQKLHQNPSSVSRDELYLWLEKAEMPITADGDFLAYKNVRSNYKDIHSGTFNNRVGDVCEMSRLDVDDDRNRTCSAGLHFCSKAYLPNFSHSDGGHTMIVKVNPADVVSIPSDYGDTKGRTWRYEVVGELSPQEAQTKVWGPITNDYDYDSDDYDYDSDDDYDSDNDQADRTLIGKVFAAYTNRYGTVNSKVAPEREVRLMRAGHVLGDEVDSFNDLTKGEAERLVSAWS